MICLKITSAVVYFMFAHIRYYCRTFPKSPIMITTFPFNTSTSKEWNELFRKKKLKRRNLFPVASRWSWTDIRNIMRKSISCSTNLFRIPYVLSLQTTSQFSGKIEDYPKKEFESKQLTEMCTICLSYILSTFTYVDVSSHFEPVFPQFLN